MVSAGRAGERRDRILAAATALFAQKGFHAATTAQIEAASGVRVAQIYRDFESKEDLVAAVVRSVVDHCLDDTVLTAAIETGDHAALRAWIRRAAAVDDAEGGPLMSEIFAEAARNEAVRRLARQMTDLVRSQLRRAVAALAPAASAARQAQFVDLAGTLAIGVMTRRGYAPSDEIATIKARLCDVIDAEMDRLLAF